MVDESASRPWNFQCLWQILQVSMERQLNERNKISFTLHHSLFKYINYTPSLGMPANIGFLFTLASLLPLWWWYREEPWHSGVQSCKSIFQTLSGYKHTISVIDPCTAHHTNATEFFLKFRVRQHRTIASVGCKVTSNEMFNESGKW